MFTLATLTCNRGEYGSYDCKGMGSPPTSAYPLSPPDCPILAVMVVVWGRTGCGHGCTCTSHWEHCNSSTAGRLKFTLRLCFFCVGSMVSERTRYRDGCAEGSGEGTHGTQEPDHIPLRSQEEGTVSGVNCTKRPHETDAGGAPISEPRDRGDIILHVRTCPTVSHLATGLGLNQTL